MADVKNWGSFIRGRWDWSRFGYESGFPRGCGFTDVDATVEFDGRQLVIEAKQYDGGAAWPGWPDNGQMELLRQEARLGKTVFVLWGCGVCNDPYALLQVGADRTSSEFFDWRSEPSKDRRRQKLKAHIDWAMGLIDDETRRVA